MSDLLSKQKVREAFGHANLNREREWGPPSILRWVRKPQVIPYLEKDILMDFIDVVPSMRYYTWA